MFFVLFCFCFFVFLGGGGGWPLKVIETITVLTKRRICLIFCLSYTEIWSPFKRKLSFFHEFTLNWTLLLLILEYFDIISVETYFFWSFLNNAWLFYKRKFLLFNELILSRILWLIKLYIYTIFTVNVNRNHHNLKNRCVSKLYLVFSIIAWLLFSRNFLHFSDLTLDRIFLLLKC